MQGRTQIFNLSSDFLFLNKRIWDSICQYNQVDLDNKTCTFSRKRILSLHKIKDVFTKVRWTLHTNISILIRYIRKYIFLFSLSSTAYVHVHDQLYWQSCNPVSTLNNSAWPFDNAVTPHYPFMLNAPCASLFPHEFPGLIESIYPFLFLIDVRYAFYLSLHARRIKENVQ